MTHAHAWYTYIYIYIYIHTEMQLIHVCILNLMCNSLRFHIIIYPTILTVRKSVCVGVRVSVPIVY